MLCYSAAVMHSQKQCISLYELSQPLAWQPELQKGQKDLQALWAWSAVMQTHVSEAFGLARYAKRSDVSEQLLGYAGTIYNA